MKRSKNAPVKQDMLLMRRLTEGFDTPEGLPCSFVYGGKPLRGMPEEWNPEVRWSLTDSRFEQAEMTALDPQTGLQLRAECRTYRDYPVMEWVLYLTNKGRADTPQIQRLKAMDIQVAFSEPRLMYSNGDACGDDSFAFFEKVLTDETFTMEPFAGRPCSHAFPYMRFLSDQEQAGVNLAIGWPGQWQADLRAEGDGFYACIGQQTTDFYLHPGETARTPRMTLMAFGGDERRGANLWRRWYMDHIMPRPYGAKLAPKAFVTAAKAPEGWPEFTAATEAQIAHALEVYTRTGIDMDAFWLDAGWYEGCGNDWTITGTWKEKKENFPNGMRAVSEHCEKAGIELMLWFEPERAFDGSWLCENHPEWLLNMAGEPRTTITSISTDSHLLNLANPEALNWLIEHIDAFIKKNKIHIYRQDYNTRPMIYWKENQEPGREGLLENQYVQGYLKYWDELLRRNPGLWIDACASGGQRNDLESMRRSVPLHYSDLAYGKHAVKIAFEQTMYDWIPYFKSQTNNWDNDEGTYEPQGFQPPDEYAYHCAMAPSIIMSDAYPDSDLSVQLRMHPVWRRAAKIALEGDFYPLTPYHKDITGWWARQFDIPEAGEGYLHFITGTRCGQNEQKVTPVLEEGCEYRFTNALTGESVVIKGGESFIQQLPKRSGAMWFYKQISR